MTISAENNHFFDSVSNADFQQLKNDLLQLQTAQLAELETLLRDIAQNTKPDRSLRSFLLEKGISIGDNVAAGFLFEVLQGVI